MGKNHYCSANHWWQCNWEECEFKTKENCAVHEFLTFSYLQLRGYYVLPNDDRPRLHVTGELINLKI